ncbi:MAG: ABC-type lipoprotein export system ATPase subunit [Rhodothermales bacterium]|jgi:ABC-type lipoprotein export system ATPase subunit
MNLLSIRNLKKSYLNPEGERVAVVDVADFSMAAGMHAALQGGSGCGKTTFLNMIAGILAPDSGEIVLDGETITGMSEAKRDRLRARQVGYIFQTFNLLQGFSALENVELGMAFAGKVRRKHAKQLLETVGLADRMGHLPSQLSVGQQQRVAVARALANSPKLILADEPTGNLDPVRAREAMALIRSVCKDQGAALLVVSHDPAMISDFDQIHDLTSINSA